MVDSLQVTSSRASVQGVTQGRRSVDLFPKKLEVPRAADVLAAELRSRIFAGELQEGDFLPAERTLVLQSGVGRSSVREALRTLELEGLISPEAGRYGGWAVRHPGRESVARSVEVFIRARKIHVSSLLETREVLEPACASFAAVNRTDDDVRELKDRCDVMDEVWTDPSRYLQENLSWHVAVVEATHNDLLVAVISALSDAIFETSEMTNVSSEDVRRTVIRVHRGVTDAIVAGDADLAFRRMHKHLHSFRMMATPHGAEMPAAPSRNGKTLRAAR